MSLSVTRSDSLADRAPRLHAKLAKLRTRLCWTEGSRRLVLVLSCMALAAGLAMLIDWWFELPLEIRYATLGLQLVLLLGLAAWLVIGVVTHKRRSVDDLALMMERTEPEFRGRLISTVQFAGGRGAFSQPESRKLVDDLFRETEKLADPHSFRNAIDYRPWRRALAIFTVIAAVALAICLVAGPVIVALIQRQLLAQTPIPRETRIVSVSFSPRVAVGDPFEVRLRAEGELPDRGKIHLRYTSGRRQELELNRLTGESNHFAAAVDAVGESFTWRARLNDARLPWHRVRAIHRPEVKHVRLTQHYPDFMNLRPSVHEPGDFHLFPGARVELEFVTNKPVTGGTLELLGIGETHALAPAAGTAESPVRSTLSVPESDLTGFTVVLRDHEGMESRLPAAFRISLAGDAPPTIHLVEPSRSEDSATSGAEVRLAWKASDRFGIRAFVLCRQLEGDKTVHRQALPLSDDEDRRVVSRSQPVDLGRISPMLSPGDKLKLWVEAVDINPATPPGVSRTVRLRIVTPEEKRRQLLGQVAGVLDRLEGVATEQETLNTKLNEVIRNP